MIRAATLLLVLVAAGCGFVTLEPVDQGFAQRNGIAYAPDPDTIVVPDGGTIVLDAQSTTPMLTVRDAAGRIVYRGRADE
jgi:uncharacterized protein YacL